MITNQALYRLSYTSDYIRTAESRRDLFLEYITL